MSGASAVTLGDEVNRETLIQNVPAGVFRFRLGPAREYRFLSSYAERITGYPIQRFVGPSSQPLLQIVHPEDADFVDAWVRLALHEKGAYEVDYRIHHSSGEVRWLHEHGLSVPVPDGGPIEVEGAFFDITELYLAGADLERTADELAQRNEELAQTRDEAVRATQSKSEFLANLSHEVRTPLNAIIGLAEVLAETALSPEQEGYLRTIRGSAKSLLNLLNDILDFAKMEAGKMNLERVPTDVGALMHEIGGLFAPQMRKKRLHLEISVDPELPPLLMVDPIRLHQVVTNLLSNAIKFTDEGAIRLNLEVLEADSASVAVKLSVQDSGIGIPEDRQSAVFEVFTQADGSTTRRYGGTGLGLTIVRQICDMMGVRLQLESAPGQGSTFSLLMTLPISDANMEPVSTPARAEVRHPRAGLRVLLAEDNAINRMVVTRMLQRLGCEVFSAENGREAVDLLRVQPMDVVLMDIQMPVLDGYQATAEIRSMPQIEKARIPVVALTANVSAEDRLRCSGAGMQGFVGKPIELDQLRETLAHFAPSQTGIPAPEVSDLAAEYSESEPSDLDMGYLSEVTAHDGEFIEEIVRTFLEVAPPRFEELERRLQEGNVLGAQSLAHELKGACGSAGACALEAIARHADQLLKSGDAVTAGTVILDWRHSLGRYAARAAELGVSRAA